MPNDEARELSLPPVVEGGGERAIGEAAAVAWLERTMILRREAVSKAEHEVAAFSGSPELRPFADNWARARARDAERLRIYEALMAIVDDRDEWRQQHENLLSVRQSDLAAATEREAAARAAGIAEGMERAAGIADLHAGSWKWLARKAKEDVEYPQYECSMPLSEECQDIATAIRAAILQGTGEGSGDA